MVALDVGGPHVLDMTRCCRTWHAEKPTLASSCALRVTLVLIALTAINVYVFFFHDGTSLTKLKEPAATSQAVREPKTTGAAPAAERRRRGQGAAGGAGRRRPAEERAVEGTIGENDTLGELLAREGLGPAAPAVLRALSRLVIPSRSGRAIATP